MVAIMILLGFCEYGMGCELGCIQWVGEGGKGSMGKLVNDSDSNQIYLNPTPNPFVIGLGLDCFFGLGRPVYGSKLQN